MSYPSYYSACFCVLILCANPCGTAQHGIWEHVCNCVDAEAAKATAAEAKEEPQTDDAEMRGAESEPGSAPAEPPSEAEAKTSGDEQTGAEAGDAEGEAKMDTDD